MKLAIFKIRDGMRASKEKYLSDLCPPKYTISTAMVIELQISLDMCPSPSLQIIDSDGILAGLDMVVSSHCHIIPTFVIMTAASFSDIKLYMTL